jgi:hypothetical protein
MIMEKVYWLSRKRASLKAAQNAVSAEARLIHYDLAGRYSLKALSCETQASDLSDALPLAIYAGGASDADRVRSGG